MKKMMRMAVFLAVLTAVYILYGCAAGQTAKEETGPAIKIKAAVAKEEPKTAQNEEATILSVEGEIESLKIISESYPKKGEVALVLIGFKDGNGVVAKGIYPGLKEGKKIRLYLKPSDIIYKGSLTYEIYKIEGL